MSISIDPTLRNLSKCGCCEGLSKVTPLKIKNRPGLKAVAYRVGKYSHFLESMLACVSSSEMQALRALATRDKDDFSIALLDAWAVVADVLTFYQERIANESYLRTATQWLSVLELARLIGYEPNPGVAAGTYLVFTIDEPIAMPTTNMPKDVLSTSMGVPAKTPIAIGTKAQSIPGPDENPQIFETVEQIEARAEWNEIKPRCRQPQILSHDMENIYIKGLSKNINTGDKVLIITGDAESQRTVRGVERVVEDVEKHITHIKLEGIDSGGVEGVLAVLKKSTKSIQSVSIGKNKPKVGEDLVEYIKEGVWDADNIASCALMKGISMDKLSKIINNFPSPQTTDNKQRVYIFRKRASVFGYNAMKQSLYDSNGIPLPPSWWVDWSTRAEDKERSNRIYLENAYKEVIPEDFIAIKNPDEKGFRAFKIISALIHPRTAYGVSSQTTELTLDRDWWLPEQSIYWWLNYNYIFDFNYIRGSVVYVQSEQLDLADKPLGRLMGRNNITLDKYYPDLQKGQHMIITGELGDEPGIIESEVAEIAQVSVDNGFTQLMFKNDLISSYLLESVTINANVALATNGETVHEILGSGDASKAFQTFTLSWAPLTYVSAANSKGAASTLEIRVNDLLWHEVPSLFGHGPEERIYVTYTNEDGKSIVRFGDGHTGARLPTGRENIRVTYRKGTGVEGNVKAGQISLLMTRPLGVKGVINPLPANGGDDLESLEKARLNAPVTLMTLGRLVSLKDYENFARSFAGIAKALATWTWTGDKRTVYLTVAGPNGGPVTGDSNVLKNLLDAIRESGDPYVQVKAGTYRKSLFRISARLKVHSDYIQGDVLASVEQQLRLHFSFDARAFGQPVTISEVISIIHKVPGVMAVDMDALYTVAPAYYRMLYNLYGAYKPKKSLESRLIAAMPEIKGNHILPAELLILDPAPVDLGVMQ